MQFSSTTIASPSILQNPLHRKHRLDELEEEQEEHGVEYAQGGGSNGRVHFSATAAGQAAGGARSQAVKRRKVDHLGFEPVFQGLSLSSNGDDAQQQKRDGAMEDEAEDELEQVDERRGRASHLPQRRRESTPFPVHEPGETSSSPSSSSNHRRRSSSRNRARNTRMDRFDPERPHVVYVDTLSDDEDTLSDDDSHSRIHFIYSSDNSPNSSDVDEVVLPSSSTRPIRINKRLRDHLRRQNVNLNGPLLEEILSNSPARTGGAGIAERGLVLYRPLMSWGIVEEPEPEEVQGNKEEDDEVRIWELQDDADLQLEGMAAQDKVAGDGDTEMDLD